MLAYLDALINALSLRDGAEVTRLLAHPLSRILPATVRDEVSAVVEGRCDSLTAPLRLMQLRHQTAELLRGSTPVAEVADAPRVHRPPPAAPARAHRPPRLVQMELPLSA